MLANPTLKPHVCEAKNAHQLLTWIRERGGLAIWNSTDFSNVESYTCPLTDAAGVVKTRPYANCESMPARVLTSTDDVVVQLTHEVKRFHVALRMGAQGFKVKVKDGSSRRIRAAVEKAGEGAYYQFDHMSQEAVIMAPTGEAISLTEWALANAA